MKERMKRESPEAQLKSTHSKARMMPPSGDLSFSGKVTSGTLPPTNNLMASNQEPPVQRMGDRRVVADAVENNSIRDEVLTGVEYNEVMGQMQARADAEPGSLNYLAAQLAANPHSQVIFGILVRSPNHVTDKLKGEDGHAAIQLSINGVADAKIQMGLGGRGQIAREVFANNYGRADDKYTITVYHSAISHERAQQVITKLRNDAGSGHAYSRLAHPLAGSINCATWAIQVARVAGFSFPLSYLLGSNPLFLGWGLKQAMWNRREYTREHQGGREIDALDEAMDQIH